MRPFSLLLFLCFFAPLKFHAQKISVNPDVFKYAHKSLLILSDDDGEVFTAEVIDSAAITDVYTLQAPPENRGQKMHFTILNEFLYTNLKGNSSSYCRAYTCYNVPDSIFIEELPEVAKFILKPSETITILIDGVNSVESVKALSPHKKMTRYFNENTNTLDIRIDAGFDPVIILNCNGEEKPRWLQIHNPQKDAGLIEFEELPIGVKPLEITFPEKADWGIALQEKHPEGYRLSQEFRMTGNVKQDKYPFLLSENIPLDYYRIRAARYVDKKQSSQLLYEWKVQDIDQMPKVNVSDFKYKFTSDSDGFVIKVKNKSVKKQKCRVLYMGTHTAFFSSGWVVEGALSPEMKFTFPNISSQIREQMVSLIGRFPFLPYNAQIIQEFENGNRVYVEEGIHKNN